MAFFPGFCAQVPKVLLHIGASDGHEAKAYVAAGIQHVIWVEGDPVVYARLVRHVEKFRHTCINALATDHDEKTVIFHTTSNQGQSSSIYPMNEHRRVYPKVKVTGHRLLATSRLDTRLRLAGVMPEIIDGVVIDVQGAELLALKGMGAYLDHVQVLVTEFSRIPLYEGGVLRDELDSFLISQGFVFVKESGGGKIGDALYIRRSESARDQQLKKESGRCHCGAEPPPVRHRKGIRRLLLSSRSTYSISGGTAARMSPGT